ncbi:NUDIX domain-containing protein [Streptomyces sp. NPDC006393]|uniref:NUDIX hydrolase n=1 Tax=Streptomyces sp. NPDC006393 TaxID=3156763 RepID=UPI00340179AD
MVIDKVAWVRIEDGRVLCARSRGKDLYYLPGGKREPGESDVQTLVREVTEEVGVSLRAESVSPLGTFEAQADGRDPGVTVRMTCFTGDYTGRLAPRSEVEELAWLSYGDRHRVSTASQAVFDHLNEAGSLF